MNPEQQKQIEMQMLQQHMQQVQEQIQSLHQQLNELKTIKESLEELKSVKNKKSIVPLGAGVFLETNIKEVKDVLLNVGSNVMVKKDVKDAQNILEKQIKELEKISYRMQNDIAQGIMQMQEK